MNQDAKIQITSFGGTSNTKHKGRTKERSAPYKGGKRGGIRRQRREGKGSGNKDLVTVIWKREKSHLGKENGATEQHGGDYNENRL